MTVLRIITQPYVAHPDYRDEWACSSLEMGALCRGAVRAAVSAPDQAAVVLGAPRSGRADPVVTADERGLRKWSSPAREARAEAYVGAGARGGYGDPATLEA